METTFVKAKPVWIKDKETVIHLRVQFKTVIKRIDHALVKIAASSTYQLWVNGEFVSYGPARAGKNYFRMDEIDLSGKFTNNQNIVIIEVAAYNTNSFVIQNQTPFLQCEVIADNLVVSYTGKDFSARINPYYYRKTQRYSFQRPMMESYHIDNTYDPFLTENLYGNEIIQTIEEKKIIKRFAPYPLYEKTLAEFLGGGEIIFSKEVAPWRDRSVVNIGEKLIGFKIEELEVFVSEDITGMNYSKCKPLTDSRLLTNCYLSYKLPYEASGFLQIKINCIKETQIYILFDELSYEYGLVNPLRLKCANVVRYDLCKGLHELQMFEPYSMQYIQIVATQGNCHIENIAMIEYKHPPIRLPNLKNEELNKIANAAAETFRQNAVDIFTDCPSRERAGWLCDSFFMARAEYYATENSLVEKSFLENFLHEKSYDFLPDGMLPMCYPADFYNGDFIPQWAMWGILQLKEYYDRTDDYDLVNRFKEKIEKLLSWFAKFENSDGLLEDLEGWNFVEWSMANQLTNGVNYPTNMMYYAMLKAVGDLYKNNDCITKALHIKDTIISQSFNGMFFTDHSLRLNGKLEDTGEITEVCQYYAFFTGIATENSHEELLRILLTDFGPRRDKNKVWSNVYPAAPFVGFFLRLEILFKLGKDKQLAEDIKDYYYDMACKTGTLWEHADTRASCNHGFSSYILCWLDHLSKMGY